MGFKLELKVDLLFNTLISDSTKKSLEEMLNSRLSQLLPIFEKIHNTILLDKDSSEYYNSLKENRNDTIYEFACLSRDLYSLLGESFELFYNDNVDVMETIMSIYKYSKVYGFESMSNVDIV